VIFLLSLLPASVIYLALLGLGLHRHAPAGARMGGQRTARVQHGGERLVADRARTPHIARAIGVRQGQHPVGRKDRGKAVRPA